MIKLKDYRSKVVFVILFVLLSLLISTFEFLLLTSFYTSEEEHLARDDLRSVKGFIDLNFLNGELDKVYKVVSPFLIKKIEKYQESRKIFDKLDDELDKIKNNLELSLVYILDRSGTVVSSSFSPTLKGKNYSHRRYFKKAITGKSDLYTSLGDSIKTSGAYFSYPMIVNGYVEYVFVMKLNLNILDEYLSYQKSKVAIINDEGTVISSNVKEVVLGNKDSLEKNSSKYKIMLKDRIESGRGIVWTIQLVNEHRKGKYFFHLLLIISVSVVAVFLGTLFLYFYVENKSARKSAEGANNAKDLFLAKITHELRTPISTMIGIADLSLKNNILKTQESNWKIIKKMGDTLLLIVNDILDYTKLKSSVLKSYSTQINLSEILQEIKEIFEFKATDKGIKFYLNNELNKDTYEVDLIKLKQILMNLLGNAVKFTAEGSVILTVQNVNDNVEFEIKDTGIGIEQDIIDKLFVPFTQGNQEITLKYGGTGLGLSISKKLADFLGGSIRVSSTPGIGSSFILSLPLKAVLQEKEQTLCVVNEKLDLSKIKCLIVDDNEINGMVTQKMLERRGVLNSQKVVTGDLAVEECKKVNYDIILMDYYMPGINGIKAIELINEIDGLNVFSVLLSANSFLSSEKIDQNLMIDLVIEKPISDKKIVRIINSYFKKKFS